MIKYLFAAILAGFFLGGVASYFWHQHQQDAMIDTYRKNQVQVNQRMGHTIHGLPVRLNNKDMN